MSQNPAVTEYIQQCPRERRDVLNQTREIMLASLPEAEETMKYGMPTYYYHENLIHFACAQKHLGIYPTPSAVVHFQKELQHYKTSKGAIQFPFDQPIPYDLIQKIALWRRAEVLAKLS